MDPLAARGPSSDGKRLDVICLGRLGVDLYAQQLGARLEEATSFAKYLGGSSANIAFGCARLGLRTAMASRVGDDHMGRFLSETLAAEGCDVSHVSVDSQRLTALVILGIRDRDTFPLIFYREQCADMAVGESDVAEEFVAASRALVITGTHFSTEHTHRVSSLALERARRHGARTVLDIDYRPVLWGLTKPEAGAERFVASDRVTSHLQGILPRFDLVVGTEEEFRIAGGRADLAEALQTVRKITPATLVLKLGAAGCAVFEGEVPRAVTQAATIPGYPVKVMNVLGAGDAFMAGLLKGWLTGLPLSEAARVANACGALVVSRHACSASMPTPAELEWFMRHPASRPDEDSALARLHRVTPARRHWENLCVFAFDHRTQFAEWAREAGTPSSRLTPLKTLLVEAVAETEAELHLKGQVGALIDDTYGDEALLAAAGRGWWIGRPVEVPGSRPLEFEGGRSIGSRLASWPREQVVKCLVRFHPDDPADLRLEQETQLRVLYDAVQVSGHELILELIPPGPPVVQDASVLFRALTRLYNLGIAPEWWKLPPLSSAGWREVDALVGRRDPYCRGVVILGLEASLSALSEAFREAATSRTCRGFVVGRTLSAVPCRDWLAGRIDDGTLVMRVRENFKNLVRAWQQARALREAV
ncbi:MAG TPA: 5-dehydro-2-deoxygluconokinase [Anaeromyxobacteraceae bacterium]|nr:5-dehydro-2-deoxygluconokinase [Anaeromyxobacteraceae bacterium]